jgi:NAD(P)-dependent dehydrogenase (short-subunit alcohol dehydrogenase family)
VLTPSRSNIPAEKYDGKAFRKTMDVNLIDAFILNQALAGWAGLLSTTPTHAGAQVIFVKVDLRDDEDIGAAVAKVAETFGGVDVLGGFRWVSPLSLLHHITGHADCIKVEHPRGEV